ncbi:Uncharacterised protein [Legionella waltersii]|nr:Uncharacterised protein [Legionella waltersii]
MTKIRVDRSGTDREIHPLHVDCLQFFIRDINATDQINTHQSFQA